MTKFTGNVLQPVLELDFFRSRHQHSEGDYLGVSVCESLVSSIGEQQLPPIGRERGERSTPHGELLCHFVAQEATKASSSVSQISCIPGRIGGSCCSPMLLTRDSQTDTPRQSPSEC